MRFERRWFWFLALPIAFGACDSEPPTGSGNSLGPDEEGAVVVGSVEGTGAQGSPGYPANTASAPAASGEARTVVIGEVRSGGSFQALADASVDARGGFRIEGVPEGRTDLVILARTEGEAEVGRVVLHEETRARTEHRAHPIDARSTLHARVFSHLQGSGKSGMSSAELALFLHTRGGVAASAAASEAQVRAIADATVRAEEALTAVLAMEGTGMDAEARGAILRARAAMRDRDRADGGGTDATQRAFVSAAVEAFEAAGVSAEALALAHAAAGTGLDHALARADANARLDLAKQAVLIGLEARKRVAARAQGSGGGIRAAVAAGLDRIEAAVRAAASVDELRASLEAERAEMRDRTVSAVLAGLPALPIELRANIEGRLRGSLTEASFWVHLDGSASGPAMAEQAARFRSQVRAAVDALVEELPSEARAGISVEAVASLVLALGCGPSVG